MSMVRIYRATNKYTQFLLIFIVLNVAFSYGFSVQTNTKERGLLKRNESEAEKREVQELKEAENISRKSFVDNVDHIIIRRQAESDEDLEKLLGLAKDEEDSNDSSEDEWDKAFEEELPTQNPHANRNIRFRTILKGRTGDKEQEPVNIDKIAKYVLVNEGLLNSYSNTAETNGDLVSDVITGSKGTAKGRSLNEDDEADTKTKTEIDLWTLGLCLMVFGVFCIAAVIVAVVCYIRRKRRRGVMVGPAEEIYEPETMQIATEPKMEMAAEQT